MDMKISRIAASQLVAGERLYLASDRVTVVREGDPRAAYLLCGKGQVIPPNEVVRLGLKENEPVTESISVQKTEVRQRQTRIVKPETRD